MSTFARVDLKKVAALAADLGIEQPLRIISHLGPFTKSCNCPDPTHKGRSFDGFHTVIDGTHEITVNVKRSPADVTRTLAHELKHAASAERGERTRHDNSIPYRQNPHEVDADKFASRFVGSGLRLAR